MAEKHVEPDGRAEEASEMDGGSVPGDLDDAELTAAEAIVEEHVQRSLAPYRGMFPPAVLEEMADDLRCFLLTHPVSHDMLTRIRPYLRAVSGGAATEVPFDVPKARKGKVG